MTYLLHIHHVYRASFPSSAAAPELPEQELVDLLMPSHSERDAAPLPPPVGSSSASTPAAPPGARSADVQALIQCTGVGSGNYIQLGSGVKILDVHFLRWSSLVNFLLSVEHVCAAVLRCQPRLLPEETCLGLSCFLCLATCLTAFPSCCPGCSRRDAIDALKRGDLHTAFLSEVRRLRINRDALGEMVVEYAAHRGLEMDAQGPCNDASGGRGSRGRDPDPALGAVGGWLMGDRSSLHREGPAHDRSGDHGGEACGSAGMAVDGEEESPGSSASAGGADGGVQVNFVPKISAQLWDRNESWVKTRLGGSS